MNEQNRLDVEPYQYNWEGYAWQSLLDFALSDCVCNMTYDPGPVGPPMKGPGEAERSFYDYPRERGTYFSGEVPSADRMEVLSTWAYHTEAICQNVLLADEPIIVEA